MHSLDLLARARTCEADFPQTNMAVAQRNKQTSGAMFNAADQSKHYQSLPPMHPGQVAPGAPLHRRNVQDVLYRKDKF